MYMQAYIRKANTCRHQDPTYANSGTKRSPLIENVVQWDPGLVAPLPLSE